MRRSCERLGCGEPAAIAYGIDIGTLVVWLEFASPDAAHHLNVLCDRHAERLIRPRGWSIEDRREGTSRLFVAAQKARPPARTKSAPAKRTSTAKVDKSSQRRERDATSRLRVVTNDGLFDPTVPMAPPFAVAAPAASHQPPDDSRSIDAMRREPLAAKAAVNEVTRSHPAREKRFFDRATANHTRPIARPTDASRAMFRDTTRSAPAPDDTYDFHQGEHVE